MDPLIKERETHRPNSQPAEAQRQASGARRTLSVGFAWQDHSDQPEAPLGK
jgi:hypothetical protein